MASACFCLQDPALTFFIDGLWLESYKKKQTLSFWSCFRPWCFITSIAALAKTPQLWHHSIPGGLCLFGHHHLDTRFLVSFSKNGRSAHTGKEPCRTKSMQDSRGSASQIAWGTMVTVWRAMVTAWGLLSGAWEEKELVASDGVWMVFLCWLTGLGYVCRHSLSMSFPSCHVSDFNYAKA